MHSPAAMLELVDATTGGPPVDDPRIVSICPADGSPCFAPDATTATTIGVTPAPRVPLAALPATGGGEAVLAVVGLGTVVVGAVAARLGRPKETP